MYSKYQQVPLVQEEILAAHETPTCSRTTEIGLGKENQTQRFQSVFEEFRVSELRAEFASVNYFQRKKRQSLPGNITNQFQNKGKTGKPGVGELAESKPDSKPIIERTIEPPKPGSIESVNTASKHAHHDSTIMRLHTSDLHCRLQYQAHLRAAYLYQFDAFLRHQLDISAQEQSHKMRLIRNMIQFQLRFERDEHIQQQQCKQIVAHQPDAYQQLVDDISLIFTEEFCQKFMPDEDFFSSLDLHTPAILSELKTSFTKDDYDALDVYL